MGVEKRTKPYKPDSGLTVESVNYANSKRYMLGVTGTMRSGKTYTCKKLVQVGAELGLNVHHVSLDDIRQYIVGTSPEYQDERGDLFNILGKHSMKTDGSIDRHILKARMLEEDEDDYQKIRLILRKPEMEVIQKRTVGKKGIVLFEWALLAEEDYLFCTEYNGLLVNCTPLIEYSRVKMMKRDTEEKEKKVRKQWRPEKKREYIIETQKRLHRGDYYEFSTNPPVRKKQYIALLEQIVANIK